MQRVGQHRMIGYSLLLHLGVMVLAVFGMPHITTPPDTDPFVVSIEVVNVASRSNIPTQKKPIVRKAPEKKPAPAPKPQIIEKDVPPPVKKEAPTPEPPPKEDAKKESESIDDVLKRLEAEAAANEPEEESQEKEAEPEKNTSRSDAEYDDSLPLALSEKDAIRSQFVRCWRMPAGARNAHELAVRVLVEVNPDGSVKMAELADGQSRRYGADPFFRAAADAAIRAVRRCSPLENLPADKYGSWRKMELNFDPKELFF
jgi:outer membrane biosynthesis protein TonB